MTPRAWVVGLLVLAAIGLYARIALLRSRALLEHDEAIALLTAAGKSQQAEQLFHETGQVRVHRASDLQAMMKPSSDTSLSDVIRSLSAYDIHPPLYFCSLRGLQLLAGGWQIPARLLGMILFMAAACAADRWIWPDASPAARFLGACWLLISPVCLEVGTELRQYALVYLGVTLSLAGLVQLQIREQGQAGRVAILASGPLILIYSHLGTAVWIAVLILVALWSLRGHLERLKQLAAAAILAMCLSAPLVLWWCYKTSRLGKSPTISPAQWWNRLWLPFSRGVAAVWMSWPVRWDADWIASIAACLLIAVCTVTAIRGGRVDRMIGFSIVVWTILWLGLIALGKVPPHVLAPKYLGPLAIGMIALLVRATRPGCPPSMRRIAASVLAMGMATHLIGIRHLLEWPVQTQVIGSLQESQFDVVTNPRRGYLFPLIEKMRADARVVIVNDNAWERLSPLLPESGALLVEIGGRSESLSDQFSHKYPQRQLVRDEPARIITAYRRP